MKRATLIALIWGCGASPDPLAAYTIPEVPEWTDRYADSTPGDPRYFNISALMAAHDLTRLQAVELQNHYRDLSRAGGGEPEGWFATALGRARAGTFESGLDPARLAGAPFIVVFDLDDTLFDQYRAGPECADIRFTGRGGKPRHILRVPGWEAAFQRIREAGGEVAFFSANLDETVQEALAHWEVDGKSVAEGVAGVLSNSHLVRQEKSEGPGAENPRKGHPVVEASKDLRLFDEKLERVVIVDDNPTRLFQLRNVRWFKKFHADQYCAADGELKGAYDKAMEAVVDEIVEAADYAKANGITFAAAFLPYSLVGQTTVRTLMETHGWDEPTAVAWVREHPKTVDKGF